MRKFLNKSTMLIMDIGKLKLILLLLFISYKSFSQTTTILDADNNNIIEVNHLRINDPGATEGIIWDNSTRQWIIDVSPEDRSNTDGNLNFYGTSGIIVNWRPVKLKGTGSNLMVDGTGDSYFMGKVGIGTNTLHQLLTLSAPDEPVLRFARSNSGNYDWEIYSKSGGGLFFRGGANGTGSALTDLFNIDPNGNVDVNGEVLWGPNGASLTTNQGAAIELRGTGRPFFDFSNDPSTDFDMRFILENDSLLLIRGGKVGIWNIKSGELSTCC